MTGFMLLDKSMRHTVVVVCVQLRPFLLIPGNGGLHTYTFYLEVLWF